MHPFDEGVALDRTDDATFHGTLDRRWWVYAGPSGGFIASIMLNAISSVEPDGRALRTLSVHYPARAAEGAFEVRAAIERRGRSATFASARMLQDGRVVTVALGVLMDHRDGAGFDHARPPSVAVPEEIAAVAVPEEVLPPFARHFDYRLALGNLPFSRAERAEIGGWVRPAQSRVVDALIVPTLADAFPPAPFAMSARPFSVPTLDLTVHFRARLPLPGASADDFYLARFRTSLAADGCFEEDGLIWSRDGVLVAQSRQLALYGADDGGPATNRGRGPASE